MSGSEAPCRRVAAAHRRAGFLRAVSNERPQGEQMNDKHESRNKITIIIDGQPYSTRDDDQEAAALLRLANKEPDEFDLAQVKKNGEQKAFKDKHLVDLKDGDKFITIAPASITVIVNGQEKTVSSRTLTYQEVTQIAFPDKVDTPEITFVVLYRKAKQPKEGSLVQGASVEVKKEGTIFNVTFTNRS